MAEATGARGTSLETRSGEYMKIRNSCAVRRRGLTFILVSLLLSSCLATTAGAAEQPIQTAANLNQLSLDDLSAIEVTSVSRRAEPLLGAPAAIFVITAEDIRRSGALSLPEALRLAPNLQVAQSSADTYAITARGFNHSTATANKLLVMIDGRTVYTPLDSGVFWDAQDVMLDDIERIEVVRGPGGTLWGANAINGVINIITRSSQTTQGGVANVGGGSGGEKDISVRYGAQISDKAAFRLYARGFDRAHTLTTAGLNGADDWTRMQFGFRGDFSAVNDDVTLQGDVYHGAANVDVTPNNTIGGGNVLTRWRHTLSDDSKIELQAYYDVAQRTLVTGITDSVSTYDINLQYNFVWGDRQQIVWGAGYRLNQDEFQKGPTTSFLSPASRGLRLSNIFIQDEIRLTSDLKIALGVKLEHNTFTGTEIMPDVRLSWLPTANSLVWAAASRAVRTPARFDRDLINPGLLAGGPSFKSEDLLAYEVGYRLQATSTLTVSLASFYNDYDNLRSVELSSAGRLPLMVANGMEGHTYGVEGWAVYQVLDWWRLSGGFNTLHKALRFKPGVRDFFGVQFAGNDPDYQFSVRSGMTFLRAVEVDLGLRRVGSLPSPFVKAYTEMDARLGWHVSESFELSLLGSNLLHSSHQEFASTSVTPRAIPRLVYASVRWGF